MEKKVLEFLQDLTQNNNREWFKANKGYYEEAKQSFEEFVGFLIPETRSFDPSIGNLTVKDTTFRIYRDVRFSKDKSPYKNNFGCFIARGGRKSGNAGYYLHIDANESFIAGGAYNPPGPNLKKIRDEIYFNYPEFMKLVNDKKFKTVFGEISGDRLVRPPKGYPSDFEGIEMLKFKSFTVFRNVTKKEVLAPGFGKQVIQVFQAMHPLVRFLNRALAY